MSIKARTELIAAIQKSYEEGVSLDEAERLASKFLFAQIGIAQELRAIDLDSRMKKSGLKAVRATVYLGEVQKNDKKPSDTLLGAIVDTNELAASAQDRFDSAEVERDELERLYNIFQNAHIHFRTLAKGSFGG